MSLKDDYAGSLRFELWRQKLHQEEQREKNQRESTCEALCRVVPTLRDWHSHPEHYGHRSYEYIYKASLATPLAPEFQAVIREFTEICPSAAWQSPLSGYRWKKCILADDSVHILNSNSPGDDRFTWGSQEYAVLSETLFKDVGTACDYKVKYDLVIFRDGFVYEPNSFADLWNGGSPLSSVSKLNHFCVRKLTQFSQYGRFS